MLAVEFVVLLDELLPQAAIRSDAAIAGRDSFSRWRMCFTPMASRAPCRRVWVLLYW